MTLQKPVLFLSSGERGTPLLSWVPYKELTSITGSEYVTNVGVSASVNVTLMCSKCQDVEKKGAKYNYNVSRHSFLVEKCLAT
jgi:hypothetical protein